MVEQRRHPILAFLEVVGWVFLVGWSYVLAVVVAIIGTDRSGGDWLFGTTEPDAGCIVWWHIAAFVPLVAAFVGLTVRVARIVRRHRSAIRRCLVGVRPDAA